MFKKETVQELNNLSQPIHQLANSLPANTSLIDSRGN